MAKAEEQTHYTIDKRIPVAVLVAIGMQFVATVWYVANLDGRVQNLEKIVGTMSARDAGRERDDRLVVDRLARMEEKISQLLDYVRRVDQRRTELP